MTLKVYTAGGSTTTLPVPEGIFVESPSTELVAQAVRAYLANQRHGNAKTKTRAEVNRTKKKVYKQKGTGGARHGARSAPIFVGGGVTHGPHGNANWHLSLSKEQKSRAVQSALTLQKAIVAAIGDGKPEKTKDVALVFAHNVPQAKHIMLVHTQDEHALAQAARNIEAVQLCVATQLNVYDIVQADSIVFTTQGLAQLADRLNKVNAISAASGKQSKSVSTRAIKAAAKKVVTAQATIASDEQIAVMAPTTPKTTKATPQTVAKLQPKVTAKTAKTVTKAAAVAKTTKATKTTKVASTTKSGKAK